MRVFNNMAAMAALNENNRNLKSWKYNVQYASERSNSYAIKTYD